MYCRQLLVDACLQEEQAAVRHSGAKIDINYKRKTFFPLFFIVLYGLDCKLFLSGKLFQYKPVIPFAIFMTVTGTKTALLPAVLMPDTGRAVGEYRPC